MIKSQYSCKSRGSATLEGNKASQSAPGGQVWWRKRQKIDTIKVGKNSLCTSCSSLHSPHATITCSSLKLGFQRDPFRSFWVLYCPWFQHISKWFLNLCKAQAYITSLDISLLVKNARTLPSKTQNAYVLQQNGMY